MLPLRKSNSPVSGEPLINFTHLKHEAEYSSFSGGPPAIIDGLPTKQSLGMALMKHFHRTPKSLPRLGLYEVFRSFCTLLLKRSTVANDRATHHTRQSNYMEQSLEREALREGMIATDL